MDDIDIMLLKLSTSPFRSKFTLRNKEVEYIRKKGLDKIEEQAEDIIKTRLAPENILNDGRQTPMKNHPVFIAMHATATCCRNCLFKWHHIDKERNLTDEEINYIVNLIMRYIKRNLE